MKKEEVLAIQSYVEETRTKIYKDYNNFESMMPLDSTSTQLAVYNSPSEGYKAHKDAFLQA
jgi:hypothetical protein